MLSLASDFMCLSILLKQYSGSGHLYLNWQTFFSSSFHNSKLLIIKTEIPWFAAQRKEMHVVIQMSHPGCIKLPGTTSVPLGILFFAFTYSSNELVMNLLNSKEWNSILTWIFWVFFLQFALILGEYFFASCIGILTGFHTSRWMYPCRLGIILSPCT